MGMEQPRGWQWSTMRPRAGQSLHSSCLPEAEISMDRGGRRFGKTVGDNETTGEALSNAGFKPAKVARRIVSQGKRRETLRKHAPKDKS